jgi:hypothetical protein
MSNVAQRAADEQIEAEAIAWRRPGHLGPKTLGQLITSAIADGEDGAFEFGALEALADDLQTLHDSIVDGTGHLNELNYGQVERLPTLIFRLAQRARAACEISHRRRRSLGLDNQDSNLPEAAE